MKMTNRHPKQGRSSACAAFTMVELLVVIGLMGIMIALVIPSLGRARDMAGSAGCRANLRQLATAFTQRTAEHRDQLNMFSQLWHRYTNDPRDLDKYGVPLTLHLLSYIVDIEPGAPPNAAGVWPEGWPHWRGNLVSFATCPTMHRILLSDCIMSSTYSMNKLAGMPLESDNWSMEQRVPTMSHIQHPSDMFMFSDGVPTSTNHYVDNAWWYIKRMHRVYFTGEQSIPPSPIVQLGFHPPYVHTREANLVYMDGRAGSYTMDQLLSRNTSYWNDAECERFWRGRVSPSY